MCIRDRFIAIIVNAMQSYTDAEQHDTRLAVKAAREHIEADLHAEMRSLRDEIRALQSMLSVGATAPSGFLQTPSSDPTAKENP